MQKWGTRTILVESGGWPNDRDKMFLRKLNAVGLLTSLYAIATGAYQEAKLESYEQLPFNGKNFYDVIVRNVKLRANSSTSAVKVDIGINVEEQPDETTGRLLLLGKIVDVGDLSTFGAFEEHDGAGLLLNDSQVQLENTFPFSSGASIF